MYSREQQKKLIEQTKELLKRAPAENFLLFVAFTEGMMVMMVELCAAQIIAPYYGNNLAVWTTVLGITLIALTSGYFAGGKIANKKTELSVLGWIMLLASLCIISVPFVVNHLFDIPYSMPWQAGWTLLSLVVLFPPLLLLGIIPPVIINFISRSSSSGGKTAGNVFAISTAGNIFSAFLLGFYLLPQSGVTVTLTLAAMIFSVLSLTIFLQEKKTGHWVIFSLVFFTGIYTLYEKKNLRTNLFRLHEFSEGLLGQLAVIDIPENNSSDQKWQGRMLLNNRIGQTYIHLENGGSQWSYVNYAASMSSVFPPKSKVLLMGLGGGTLAKILSEQLQFQVTAVELDERMEMIAKKYFGLPENVMVKVDDGRHFIKNEKTVYQVIIMDTYRGDTPPNHLSTEECFGEIKKLLSPDGMLILNYYGFLEGKKGRTLKSIVKTLQHVGFETSLVPTMEEEQYRNMLIVASQKNIGFNNTRAALNISGNEINIDSIKMKLSDTELFSAQILRDNQPIQELWNIEPATAWRKNYYENFTKNFLINGVPLFK